MDRAISGQSTITVQVKRTRLDAVLPRYQTSGSAGMDLHAALDAPIAIAPGARAMISTGLSFAIPNGWEGQVRPRSGLAAKHGVTVINAPGTVDSDYRGDVGVVLVNHGGDPFVVKPGDRIAQIVFARYSRATLREVDALDDTSRGGGGYGSTGV
jgi:dUTP pyrophosphatase